MQPMLIITGTPGLITLGGQYCGETGRGALPLLADGVAHIAYQPLADAENPPEACALRLRLGDGELRGDIAGPAWAVQWPSGVIELEFRARARPAPQPPTLLCQAQGVLAFTQDHTLCVGFSQHETVTLCPFESGTRATFVELPQAPFPCIALRTDAQDEVSLHMLSLLAGAPRVPLSVTGLHAQLTPDGAFSMLSPPRDTVGHTWLATYAPTARGEFRLVRRERAWADGGPRWPQTPIDTARAFLEALRDDNPEEAAAYLLRPAELAAIRAQLPAFSQVIALRYPHPGIAPLELGVLVPAAPQLAHVRAVSFAHQAQTHAQGAWKLQFVEA